MTSEKDSNADKSKRELLRHTLATLAYRGAKTLANAPDGFADFRAGEKTRTPGEILAHIGDLLDWAINLVKGEYLYNESKQLPWEEAVNRFFSAMHAFDALLASDVPIGFPLEKIFQGPIADALTHVGQISMLRGMANAPVRGESYFKAEIVAGRVGPEQAKPGYEFD